jgi:hypothetical protein
MSQQSSTKTNYPLITIVENPLVKEMSRFEPGKLFRNTGLDRAMFRNFRGDEFPAKGVVGPLENMKIGQNYLILEQVREGYYTCYLKVLTENGIVGWLYVELREFGSKLVLVEP